MNNFATNAYVIGEIVISVVGLVGAGALFILSTNPAATTLSSMLVSAVIVFWFSRRATEQATNKIQEISNGNLRALNDRIDALTAQLTAQAIAAAAATEPPKRLT